MTKREKREAARLFGRSGGLVGGPARARALSKRRRAEISRQGGLATSGVPRRCSRCHKPGHNARTCPKA